MIVLHEGHRYELAHVDGTKTTKVQFVNKEPGHECEGVTTQELCRMLIDRTRYCNNCLPHRVNEEIIYHFRKIIALHEARAIERATDKGEIVPEDINVGSNGHWILPHREPNYGETRNLEAVLGFSSPDSKPVYKK